jgi:2Fe-2S ferredoxin
MARVTYIEHDGTEHVIDVPLGSSVMEGAIQNDVSGIEADCGGACSCATCHVFVDAAWRDRTGAAEDMETTMLEFVDGANESSRLSCQIRVSDDLDGLIVRLPASQY